MAPTASKQLVTVLLLACRSACASAVGGGREVVVDTKALQSRIVGSLDPSIDSLAGSSSLDDLEKVAALDSESSASFVSANEEEDGDAATVASAVAASADLDEDEHEDDSDRGPFFDRFKWRRGGKRRSETTTAPEEPRATEAEAQKEQQPTEKTKPKIAPNSTKEVPAVPTWESERAEKVDNAPAVDPAGRDSLTKAKLKKLEEAKAKELELEEAKAKLKKLKKLMDAQAAKKANSTAANGTAATEVAAAAPAAERTTEAEAEAPATRAAGSETELAPPSSWGSRSLSATFGHNRALDSEKPADDAVQKRNSDEDLAPPTAANSSKPAAPAQQPEAEEHVAPPVEEDTSKPAAPAQQPEAEEHIAPPAEADSSKPAAPVITRDFEKNLRPSTAADSSKPAAPVQQPEAEEHVAPPVEADASKPAAPVQKPVAGEDVVPPVEADSSKPADKDHKPIVMSPTPAHEEEDDTMYDTMLAPPAEAESSKPAAPVQQQVAEEHVAPPAEAESSTPAAPVQQPAAAPIVEHEEDKTEKKAEEVARQHEDIKKHTGKQLPRGGQGRVEGKATGDPHLQNLRGQKFDLVQPGIHTFVQIPRFAEPWNLFRVSADVRRAGPSCEDMYIMAANVTGRWALTKEHRRGMHFDVLTPDRRNMGRWMHFGGKVDLKVAIGHTPRGTKYLNLFLRNLRKANLTVGGLLGEDDHTAAATPSSHCRRTLSVLQMMPSLSESSESSGTRSVAEASL